MILPCILCSCCKHGDFDISKLLSDCDPPLFPEASRHARSHALTAAASNMLRLAAFAHDVAGFDAAAFRLARTEAVALDPQARTLLQQVGAARQVIVLLLSISKCNLFSPLCGWLDPQARTLLQQIGAARQVRSFQTNQPQPVLSCCSALPQTKMYHTF